VEGQYPAVISQNGAFSEELSWNVPVLFHLWSFSPYFGFPPAGINLICSECRLGETLHWARKLGRIPGCHRGE